VIRGAIRRERMQAMAAMMESRYAAACAHYTRAIALVSLGLASASADVNFNMVEYISSGGGKQLNVNVSPRSSSSSAAANNDGSLPPFNAANTLRLARLFVCRASARFVAGDVAGGAQQDADVACALATLHVQHETLSSLSANSVDLVPPHPLAVTVSSDVDGDGRCSLSLTLHVPPTDDNENDSSSTKRHRRPELLPPLDNSSALASYCSAPSRVIDYLAESIGRVATSGWLAAAQASLSCSAQTLRDLLRPPTAAIESGGGGDGDDEAADAWEYVWRLQRAEVTPHDLAGVIVKGYGARVCGARGAESSGDDVGDFGNDDFDDCDLPLLVPVGEALSHFGSNADYRRPIAELGLSDEERAERALREKQAGNAAYSLGGANFLTALAHYTRAIQLNDSDPIFYSNRALVYLKLGRFKECIADCTASNDRRETIKAYHRRAAAWAALGDFERAAQDYHRALRFEESNLSCLSELEKCLSFLTDQRLRQYTQYRKKHPEVVSAASSSLMLSGADDNLVRRWMRLDLLYTRYENTKNELDTVRSRIVNVQ
jgi:tetratricopeptide (TPR) repeat protein